MLVCSSSGSTMKWLCMNPSPLPFPPDMAQALMKPPCYSYSVNSFFSSLSLSFFLSSQQNISVPLSLSLHTYPKPTHHHHHNVQGCHRCCPPRCCRLGAGLYDQHPSTWEINQHGWPQMLTLFSPFVSMSRCVVPRLPSLSPPHSHPLDLPTAPIPPSPGIACGMS